MPNDKSSERHRMVVEEVEIPAKTEDSPKTEIIDEEEKVSSEELINNDNVQLTNSTEVQDVPEKIETHSTHDQIKREQIMNSRTKQKSPVFWILIPGIFILGAILGGIIFYQNHTNLQEVKNTPTPQASTAAIATTIPSASPSAKISEFDIAIYNGSGIAGEAGKVKTLLEGAGFTVVSTGNAATYDYTKTIIKAKSSVDASVITKLKETLSKNYSVGDSQTLSTSSTTDIQIVVGSSKSD